MVLNQSNKVSRFEPEPCKYGLSPSNYNFAFKCDLDIFSFPVTPKEVVGGCELINSSRISGRIAEQELINSLCSRVVGDSSEISKEVAGLLDVIDGWATSFFICEAVDMNGRGAGGFVNYSEKAIVVTFKEPNFFLEALRHEVHHIIQFEYGLEETVLGIDVYDQAIASVFDSDLYNDFGADGLIREFESFTIEHIPFMAISIYESLKNGIAIDDTIYAATKSRKRTIRWCAENRMLPLYGDAPSPFSSDEVALNSVGSCAGVSHPFFKSANFDAYKSLVSNSGIGWSYRCGEVASMSDTSDFLLKTPYGMALNYIDKLAEDGDVFGNLVALPPDPIKYDFMGVFYNMFGNDLSPYLVKFADKTTYRHLHSVEVNILGLSIVCSNTLARRFILERYVAWDRISKVHWSRTPDGSFAIETDFFQMGFSSLELMTGNSDKNAFEDSRRIYIELMHWTAFSKWLLSYPSRPSFNSRADLDELCEHSMQDVFEDGYPLTMASE